MMLLALILQAAAPDSAKLALARQVAEAGALVSFLPLVAEKDLADLTAEDTTLTAAQRAQVVATGQRIVATRRAQLIDAFARGYAERLSSAELSALARAVKQPEWVHKRAVDLPVTMAALKAVGEVDLKKETAAATCAEAHLLCGRQ